MESGGATLPTDLLLTVAEVAIAVMGFAAIVLALRVRSGESRDDLLSRTRLSIMIESSSAALAFSFLPFLFAATELPSSTIMAISNLTLAAATLAIITMIFTRQRKRFGSWVLPESRVFDSTGLSVVCCLVGLLCARGLGYAPELGSSPYIAVLFWYLTIAIYVFVRIVFFASKYPGD